MLVYEDNSFERDLSHVNELIKTRIFASLPNDPFQLIVEEAVKKYI